MTGYGPTENAADAAALRTVKVVHTVAWAFLLAALHYFLPIPFAAWRRHLGWKHLLLIAHLSPSKSSSWR